MYLLYSVTEIKTFFLTMSDQHVLVFIVYACKNLGLQFTSQKKKKKYGTFSLPSHMPIA